MIRNAIQVGSKDSGMDSRRRRRKEGREDDPEVPLCRDAGCMVKIGIWEQECIS